MPFRHSNFVFFSSFLLAHRPKTSRVRALPWPYFWVKNKKRYFMGLYPFASRYWARYPTGTKFGYSLYLTVSCVRSHSQCGYGGAKPFISLAALRLLPSIVPPDTILGSILHGAPSDLICAMYQVDSPVIYGTYFVIYGGYCSNMTAYMTFPQSGVPNPFIACFI